MKENINAIVALILMLACASISGWCARGIYDKDVKEVSMEYIWPGDGEVKEIAITKRGRWIESVQIDKGRIIKGNQ